MRFDFDHALGKSEDFLFRQLNSRAAREAQKRKVKRGIDEVFRRVRRSAIVMLLLLSALVSYSIIVGGIDFLTWLIALPTVFLASVVALFWPSLRRQPRFEQREAAPKLDVLTSRSEEWLVDCCRELPRAALPAVDTILLRLNELRPDLSSLSVDTPIGGETQRLIGQHLPRLVDTYLALPIATRDAGSENSRRFAESLNIVADELGRLASEVHRDRNSDFDTHRRFIETRYKDE
jgi:hypothetical protein